MKDRDIETIKAQFRYTFSSGSGQAVIEFLEKRFCDVPIATSGDDNNLIMIGIRQGKADLIREIKDLFKE